MYIVQVKHPGKMQRVWPTVVLTILTYSLVLGGLIYLSFIYSESWTFLEATYKFMYVFYFLSQNLNKLIANHFCVVNSEID